MQVIWAQVENLQDKSPGKPQIELGFLEWS